MSLQGNWGIKKTSYNKDSKDNNIVESINDTIKKHKKDLKNVNNIDS